MKEEKSNKYDFQYPFSKCKMFNVQFNHENLNSSSDLNTWYTTLLHNISCILLHTFPYLYEVMLQFFCFDWVEILLS